MFSPPFLIIRPPPSPRNSHATRLVTSKAPVTPTGLTAAATHLTSPGLSAVSAAHASQLPDGTGLGGAGVTTGGGGGGRYDRKVSTRDHGPISLPSASPMRTCQYSVVS